MLISGASTALICNQVHSRAESPRRTSVLAPLGTAGAQMTYRTAVFSKLVVCYWVIA